MVVFNDLLNSFILMWSVIDPIGTVPVFLAVTKKYDSSEKRRIAKLASISAFAILLFFFIVGEVLLRRAGVPISAFQISGGVILFMFAINMIFGSSKPEEEIQLVKNGNDTAIFPLAIPSIAGPGAILAMVLLNDGGGISFAKQGVTIIVLIIILLINYMMMHFSDSIQKRIGDSGAIVISKIMGLILASIAANNVLLGIKVFFKI